MFKPSDLGADLLGWFDASDVASVTMVGAKVSQWINKGAGALTLTQSNDAYRPTYANKAVSFATGQIMAAANAPAGYDLVMVSKPLAGATDWRTLLRNTSHPTVNAHQVIIESLSQCLGTYNAGMFQAGLTRVSPINMTADNAPAPYVASASSVYDAVNYQAYRAFDGNGATFAHSLGVVPPEWTIRINLGTPQHFVSRYSYTARPDSNPPTQQWKTWKLYGTRDNWASWDEIDSVVSEPFFATSEKRMYGVTTPALYNQFQWNVAAGQNNDASPAYAGVTLLELFTGLTWANTIGLMYGRFSDGTIPQMSRDGNALVSTGTTIASGGSVFQVFGGYNGPPPSQAWGDVNEIIFIPYNTSDTIRQKLEGYLAHKWAIASLLPAGHPYKSAPPIGGNVPSTVYTASPALSTDDNNARTNFRQFVKLSANSKGSLQVRFRSAISGGLQLMGASFGKWDGSAISSVSGDMTAAPFRLKFGGSDGVIIGVNTAVVSDLTPHPGLTLNAGDWVIVAFYCGASAAASNQKYSTGHTTATTMFKSDVSTDRSQQQSIASDGGWSIVGNVQPGGAGGYNFSVDLIETT